MHNDQQRLNIELNLSRYHSFVFISSNIKTKTQTNAFTVH
jgi:hypothetical protein